MKTKNKEKAAPAKGAPSKELYAEYLKYRADWIMYRFVKELERMEREGRFENRTDFFALIGMSRNTLLAARQRTYKKDGELVRRVIHAGHLDMLKLKYNADVRFILHGVEDADISLPYRNTPSGKVPIGTPEWKRVYRYSQPATWTIGPRRAGDDQQRFEAAYYMTPSQEYWEKNVYGKPYEELPEANAN